jgi:hypothetical protein
MERAMVFEVVTTDGTVERIDGADSYELEGPLTTFFLSNSRVHRLSSWSERVASFRTDRLLTVRCIPTLTPVGDSVAIHEVAAPA